MTDFPRFPHDTPISMDGDIKDALNFSPAAWRIARLIRNSDGPLTVGIMGPWGAGKSSFVNLMRDFLENPQSNGEKVDPVPTVHFGAWRFEQEQQPLLPLIETILHTLTLDTRKSNILAEGFGALLKGMSLKFGVVVDFEKVAKAHREAIDSRFKGLRKNGPYQQLDITLAEIIREDEYPKSLRLVVIIDDLDRCLPEYVLSLLQQIKLILDIPGVAFVFAINPKPLEAYLGKRYQDWFGDTHSELAGSFLDKLINIPVWLPPLSDRFEQYAMAVLDANLRGGASVIFPPSVLISIGEACQHNPRRFLRLVSYLVLDYDHGCPQSCQSGDSALALLTPVSVARELRKNEPDLYEKLRKQSTLCDELGTTTNPQHLRLVLKHIANNNQGINRHVLNNDQTLCQSIRENSHFIYLLASGPGSEWLTNNWLRDATDGVVKMIEDYDTKLIGDIDNALQTLAGNDDDATLGAMQTLWARLSDDQHILCSLVSSQLHERKQQACKRLCELSYSKDRPRHVREDALFYASKLNCPKC